MRKRQIQIPPPAVLLGVEISYAAFVRHLCDTDNRFTRTAAGVRTAMRIELSIHNAAHHVHVLEESDWNVLQEIAETPTDGYPELLQSSKDGTTQKKFQTGRVCLAFVDAISSASLLVE